MDDLTTGLAKAKRQPWLTRSTGIMLGLVIACAGFLAGVKVQQAYGSTDAGAASRPGAGTNLSGFGNRQGGQGGLGQQPSAAAQATIGKVKLVDGNTIYIETADGTVITVKTTATTVVQSAKTVTLKDLAVGTEVRVQGSAAGTEALSATTITATLP